jgi:hypothetical protein
MNGEVATPSVAAVCLMVSISPSGGVAGGS